MKTKVKKFIEKQKLTGIQPKRISKVQDARRLLATYIYHLQVGEVNPDQAKTMAYLLIKYAELYKLETIENLELRLSELEGKLNDTV